MLSAADLWDAFFLGCKLALLNGIKIAMLSYLYYRVPGGLRDVLERRALFGPGIAMSCVRFFIIWVTVAAGYIFITTVIMHTSRPAHAVLAYTLVMSVPIALAAPPTYHLCSRLWKR